MRVNILTKQDTLETSSTDSEYEMCSIKDLNVTTVWIVITPSIKKLKNGKIIKGLYLAHIDKIGRKAFKLYIISENLLRLNFKSINVVFWAILSHTQSASDLKLSSHGIEDLVKLQVSRSWPEYVKYCNVIHSTKKPVICNIIDTQNILLYVELKYTAVSKKYKENSLLSTIKYHRDWLSNWGHQYANQKIGHFCQESKTPHCSNGGNVFCKQEICSYI